jgi:CCR4-NOT transcriptional regulation complex NOT5 subunit
MALCRCKKNHIPRNTKKNKYFYYCEPIGYPETSSICGISECNTIGYIFLTEPEYQNFIAGQRIFTYATATTKVKVKDKIPKLIS